MTTKAQEMKALEQIRKIVESLGENSYIGTAFEGCFEIAEQNIENDWGCSMKQQLETEEANRMLIYDEYEKVKKANEEQEKKIKELEKRTISPEEATSIGNFLWMVKNEKTADCKGFAETIVEYAETPNDIAFIDAVQAHRSAKDFIEKCNRLIRKMEKITRA